MKRSGLFRLPLAAITVVAAAASTPVAVAGQHVRGTLVGTEGGVAGAIVYLLDAQGTVLTRAITDQRGGYEIRAAAPGRYRLRAERIGFDNTESEVFELSAADTAIMMLQAAARAIPLEEVSATATARCEVRPTDGAATARLWAEARKALDAALYTQQTGQLEFRAIRYVRHLDPEGRRVVSETSRTIGPFSGPPFMSIPTSQLINGGFATAEGNETVLFAPTAEVLLSEPFLDTHCFRARGLSNGLVGLDFEPVPGRDDIPEIRGTLWLEPATGNLRHIDYGYRYLNVPGPFELYGGRVEFEHVAPGSWAVKSWHIRSPMLVRMVGAESETYAVRGLQEEGGDIIEVTQRGRRVRGSLRSRIAGVVYDSAAGGPLSAARVYLAGTGYTTVTDGAGRYAFDNVADGLYLINFEHSRLAEYGVSLAADTIDVVAERQEIRHDLAVPDLTSLHAAYCDADDNRSVLVGRVRARGSAVAVPGAEITVSWDGRKRETTRTDGQGVYIFCELPLGRTATVQAQMWRQTSIADSVPLGPLVRRDFELNIRSAEGVSGQVTSYSPAAGPVTLRGRLIDSDTDAPINGAGIRIVGTDRVTSTDESGRFVVEGIAPADYQLEVQHIAYGTRLQALRLPDGGTVSMDIRVEPEAIAVEGFEVESERSGVRMARTSGARHPIVDVAAIDSMITSGARLIDLVERRLAGLRIREGTFITPDNNYAEPILCIEATRGFDKPSQDPSRFCNMVAIYVDGMHLRAPGAFLRNLGLQEFDRIEFLTPLEATLLYGLHGERGALLLYTRSGPRTRQ